MHDDRDPDDAPSVIAMLAACIVGWLVVASLVLVWRALA